MSFVFQDWPLSIKIDGNSASGKNQSGAFWDLSLLDSFPFPSVSHILKTQCSDRIESSSLDNKSAFGIQSCVARYKKVKKYTTEEKERMAKCINFVL